MLGRVSFAALFVALGACGGSGGDDDGGDDAPPVDAANATVVEVNPCPATPDATVTTPGFRYEPNAVTITQGQVIKFELGPGSHDVAPLPPMTDPGLRVGFDATKCLRFTATGTFNYKCTPHGFTGSVVVQ